VDVGVEVGVAVRVHVGVEVAVLVAVRVGLGVIVEVRVTVGVFEVVPQFVLTLAEKPELANPAPPSRGSKPVSMSTRYQAVLKVMPWLPRSSKKALRSKSVTEVVMLVRR